MSGYIYVDSTGDLTIQGGGTVTVGDTVWVDGGNLIFEADLISGITGIYAYSAATVNMIGNIDILSRGTGVYAADPSTAVTITGNITVESGYNVDVYDGASVTVNGNLINTGTADSTAVIANYGAYVDIYGNITATCCGVSAYGDQSEVYVSGNIDAGIGGAVVAGDSAVTVDGNVNMEADGEYCVNAFGDTTIVIGGNVTAEGEGNIGVLAYGGVDKASVSVGGNVIISGEINVAVFADVNGSIEVTGNVIVDGDESCGVLAYGGSEEASVSVGGNISASGNESVAVYAEVNSTVDVIGDVTATGEDVIGIDAYDGAIITVGHNVVITGANGIGVQVQYGSEVTIEGNIFAPIYISFGPLTIDGTLYDPYTITAADNDGSSLKDGYLQYSITYMGGQSMNIPFTDYVWVRGLTFEIPDEPTLPGTGDTRALILGSSVLLLALMGAGALVLSRRKAQQS
jgi:hypothetical protein